MINFLDISYLKSGNKKQTDAYQALTKNRILAKLAKYDPILVGTIPIEIDIDGSDLDIICYAPDRKKFIDSLNNNFNTEEGFRISENELFNSIKANFTIEDFEIEIFAQNIESTQQHAYRHMIIEHNILLEKGEAFKRQIIELKKQGYKTEPAFAKLLNLKGNPYKELLNLTS